METQKLEVLLKIIDTGSLTQAAEAMGYTQSGVSHILKALEKELNTRLLVRDRAGVQLSPDCACLLPYIRSAVQAYRELSNKVVNLHNLEYGTVRIGTFSSVSVHWLPGILQTFQAAYPNIDFALLHGNYGEIAEWIAQGRVDCGFTVSPEMEGIANAFLKEDRLFVLLPQGHPLSRYPAIAPEALAKERFILVDEGKDCVIRSLLEAQRINLNIRFMAVDDYAIVAMVEKGLGISVLPELLLHRTPHDVVVRPLDTPFRRRLSISYKQSYDLPPAARRFIRHAQQWVAENVEL